MGSPELAKMADFYAELTGRFALTDSLALWRDSSERLHQLATELEDVTYREVTANGVPALWVIPAGSSPEHVLLHSHSGGSVVASMYMERKAVGHVAKAVGSRAHGPRPRTPRRTTGTGRAGCPGAARSRTGRPGRSPRTRAS